MKTLEEMTLEELKACAYDQIVQREQADGNLRLLNAEIQKRAQAKPEVVES